MPPSGGWRKQCKKKRKSKGKRNVFSCFSWRGREDLNLRDAFYTSYSLSRGAPSASWVLPQVDGKIQLAERVGFEPTDAFTSPVFKTGAFNRSAISPDHEFASSLKRRYYTTTSSIVLSTKNPLFLAESDFAQILAFFVRRAYHKHSTQEELTMICEICKEESFLSQRAEIATPADWTTAQDLLDTLRFHKDSCVGMAANMIGINKRIIVFGNDGDYVLMFNPVIVKKSSPYEVAEGCLSLTGTRSVKRYKSIKVQWQNEDFQTRLKTFTGWTAEIIQHEIDHCEGILI